MHTDCIKTPSIKNDLLEQKVLPCNETLQNFEFQVKLMFKIVSNELPSNLVENFIPLQDVHSYHTGQTINSIFFLPSAFNSLTLNQLAFRGTKFWCDLNVNLKHFTLIALKNI